MKKVRTVDDVIFETAEPPITLLKGAVFLVELVTRNSIVLQAEDGEYYEIDLDTFEAGFEAMA